MPFFFFFYFLLIFFPYLPLSSASTSRPIQNRRTLHQPFFPLEDTLPPTLPPTFPPSSLPKFPSSTNQNPFFPFYPSRPPPPPHSPTSITSFPANISSLIAPHSLSKKPFSIKLLLTILLPLLSVVLFAALAFFIYRRHHNLTKEAPGLDDHHRLFPTDPLPSDNEHHRKTDAVVSSTSSEFLYLGTVGNSRGADGDSGIEEGSSGSVSAYQKLSSPELHPLPPLAHQFRHNYRNADPGSSEDEFYSPRGSSGEKESPVATAGTSSRRVFPAPEEEKFGGRSSNSSTLSYPSSNSASPVQSPLKSPSPPLSYIAGDVRFRQQLRPRTPSPPKRKSTSLSPPTSLPEKDSVNISRQNQESSVKIDSYSGNPFSVEPPHPPPPPPAGYWETPRPTLTRPPVLVTPRIAGLKNPTAASAELLENLGTAERNGETPRPKLKPLHWDKVRASSDRAMVWDQLKSSSFQLNEEMIETLFVCNAGNSGPKETIRRSPLPLPNQENLVLDPKKSQNIAILLRALNVTKEEVCEALLEGNADGLGTELLETLLKMAPTKEEEFKLKEYKDDAPFKLGPAEKFLKAVLDIPFAFKRVDAMLYICNFDSEIKYLEKSFETLEAACAELRSSRLFMKLLEAVLKTGNRMNVGTNRGDAQAFKLDTLLKLVDIKGTDGKTTLLHFVVQEIIRSEGSRLSAPDHIPTTAKTDQQHTFRDDIEFKKLGLQVVAGLGGELSDVKKAAAIDSDVLSSYVSKLAGGIGKISEVASLNDTMTLDESSRKFSQAMNGFLNKAKEELVKLQAQERATLSLVKEITEYFHGNSAKEEAHPFRIFMVVRDFLSILDQVCKEVGKITDRTIVSSARQFPVSNNQMLPPVFPIFQVRRPESSDDDDSSLSS